MKIQGIEVCGIDRVVIDHKFVWTRECLEWRLSNSPRNRKTFEQMADYVRSMAANTHNHVWIHHDTLNVVRRVGSCHDATTK